MWITIETIVDADNGNVIAKHVVDTIVSPANQVINPANQAAKIDFIQAIKAYQTTPALMVGTGWDQIAKNAGYPGKTLLDVLLAEIVRLNDAPARAVLGI